MMNPAFFANTHTRAIDGRRSRALLCSWLMLFVCVALSGCRARRDAPGTVVMTIESSPNNLDLRQGTDAQSARLGSLIFDALVRKDEHYNLRPWLATSWEQPDALTWVFHLRDGVFFQNGKPLTADDVAYTINSLIDGTLVTGKSGNFASVQKADARDRLTVVVHMKRPDEGLLFNMSDGLFGVVPKGAGRDFGLHPNGTGPFEFVSAVQDKDVILKRNPHYWVPSPPLPAGAHRIEQVRFEVVPDAITSALELQKGSADLASNVLTLDMVHELRSNPNLQVETGLGSQVFYLTFNVTDPLLKDRRVRQAVACAIDRQAIVRDLWRSQARVANTLLPIGHWAAADESQMAQYPHDVARAERLLDEAGFHPDKDGVRLTITLKTSTDESTRLMAMVLQQQMRAAGIRLNIRAAEFGTFYSDVTRGAFQMYALKWIDSNEDPDIFHYAYATESFPPHGGNRGRYSNPKLDALLKSAAAETDQQKRRTEYIEVQQILSEDLPSIPLWYPNNEVVHTHRVGGIQQRGSGSFAFLRDAWVR
jgi:peptide/nickel transport system substrate-binding protein